MRQSDTVQAHVLNAQAVEFVEEYSDEPLDDEVPYIPFEDDSNEFFDPAYIEQTVVEQTKARFYDDDVQISRIQVLMY